MKADLHLPLRGEILRRANLKFAQEVPAFDDAGANGLVLFNRFYQPDFDLEKLEVRPNLLLSTPQALRLPLHT